MPRLLPSQLFRFIVTIPVILLLIPLSQALAQQKSILPPPNSQAQLEEHVKELEKRLNEAEQKAASAAMEKDYITRIQKQYETYYEKAFNTQVAILSVIALFITIIFGLVAKFGFGIFDRTIQLNLTEASTKLRTEFAERLAKETNELREANLAELKALEDGLSKRLTEQEKDLKTRSDYQFHFVRGLAGAVYKSYADAREVFRAALAIYKSTKPKQLIEKSYGVTCARNIFITIQREDEANFVEKAKKELADELYNDLEDELALVAVDITWLAPLLAERKPAPNPLPARRES
jgi:hypothetical protein